jgi:hypothetical protein
MNTIFHKKKIIRRLHKIFPTFSCSILQDQSIHLENSNHCLIIWWRQFPKYTKSRQNSTSYIFCSENLFFWLFKFIYEKTEDGSLYFNGSIASRFIMYMDLYVVGSSPTRSNNVIKETKVFQNYSIAFSRFSNFYREFSNCLLQRLFENKFK